MNDDELLLGDKHANVWLLGHHHCPREGVDIATNSGKPSYKAGRRAIWI